MAVYNGEKFLRKQLESIVSQNYTEWKLYIRDDCSTDETNKIICEFKYKYHKKISILDNCGKRLGAKENFIYLFNCNEVEKAEFYLFCDQDDEWRPNKLEHLVNLLQKQDNTEPILMYHNLKVVDADGNLLSDTFSDYTGLRLRKKKTFQQLLMYNCVPGCSIIFNNRLKLITGEIPYQCYMHDWWLLLVAECLNGKIIFCNETLGDYRQHENNEVGADPKNDIKIILKYIIRNGIKKMKENNRSMKLERKKQAELMVDNFGEKMQVEKLKVINDFINILNDKKKLRCLLKGIKEGYTFYNISMTSKFYLF